MKSLKRNILFGVVLVLFLSLYGVNYAKASDNDEFVIENGELTQYNGEGGDVAVPENVTKISSMVFTDNDDASNITSVSIPENTVKIESGTFINCKNLRQIIVDAKNKQFISENGILFNKDKTILLTYPAGKVGSYIIPNTVNRVNEYAFYNCIGLDNIGIPSSVTVIGGEAFWRTGLVFLEIPRTVNTIESNAFSNCEKLVNVSIPSNLKLFSGACFMNTPWLANKRKENKYVVINSILVDCTIAGPKIKVPNNVKVISYGVYSFEDENAVLISEIYIPEGVTTIQDGAFTLAGNIKKITIPKSVKKIGDSCFYGSTDKLIIYGYKGSYAQKFAKKQGIKFKTIK